MSVDAKRGELDRLSANDFVMLARPAGFWSDEAWRGLTAEQRLHDIVFRLPGRLHGVAYSLHALMMGMEPTRAGALDGHAHALLDIAHLIGRAITARAVEQHAADEAKERAAKLRGKKPAPVKVVAARVKAARARKVPA